jgi:DNA-directed RNA polymerase subunit M/transcription elongation factor TFIIS
LVRKSKHKNKKKKVAKETETPSPNTKDSDSSSNVIDITQDSNEENAKVVKSKDKKFDEIDEYFEEPFHANKTDMGEKLMYKCKWCGNVYKKGKGT